MTKEERIQKLISDDFDIVVEQDFNPDFVLALGVDSFEKGFNFGTINGIVISAIGVISVMTIKKNFGPVKLYFKELIRARKENDYGRSIQE